MAKPGVPTTYEAIVHGTTPTLELFRSKAPVATPSDTALEAAIRAALAAEPRLQGAQIDVFARESIVWLTGTAVGPGTAAFAAAVAKNIPGVAEVKSEIVLEHR